MRTGIMGGTFNPPHNGHLLAAMHVRQALGLDRVLFIPTSLPPHKQLPPGSATAAQRCEMVRLMLEGHDWAQLSTMEIERGGASYTIDTLQQLHRELPQDDIFLIMGTDMLLTLDSWRAPTEICRLCTLAVVAREEDGRAQLARRAAQLREQYGACIRLIDCPVFPVSSTELRAGGSLRQRAPAAVCDYIEKEKLYLHGH